MGASTFDYHKDKEKTLAGRARGMFTVGDIGYLDADGYLYLRDRKGDMIISGGVNIYPAEIEAELSCHPAVADVAVFGMPKTIDYVAELPRDPNGKLYKRRLRDPCWAARDRAI
jgi:long-chain acyl-CoA synthetase